jgi:PadR family transcriptional regulator, regulatory protein PadR
MRRSPGSLVPLELSILWAAVKLRRRGIEEFHGYQLAKHLADVSDRKQLTAYGTLYRALGRLESMGMLQSAWEDPRRAAADNRPGRRLYTLTADGIAAARQPDESARTKVARRKRIAPA